MELYSDLYEEILEATYLWEPNKEHTKYGTSSWIVNMYCQMGGKENQQKEKEKYVRKDGIPKEEGVQDVVNRKHEGRKTNNIAKLLAQVSLKDWEALRESTPNPIEENSKIKGILMAQFDNLYQRTHSMSLWLQAQKNTRFQRLNV